MTKDKVFEKRNKPRGRSLSKKLWYGVKGLVTGKVHMTYGNPIAHGC